MRIAYLEPATLVMQGDQIYRTVQPARALAQEPSHYVVAGSFLQRPMHHALETADVVVLCQAVDLDLLALLHRRKRRGQMTLVELNDNIFEPKAFGQVQHFYHDPATLSLTLQLAREAHGLIVSTPYLQALYQSLNRNCLLLINGVDDVDAMSVDAVDPEPRRSLQERGEIRVGWAGSSGHIDDVRAVLASLKRLLCANNKITLCIMAPRELHHLFDEVPKHQLELRAASNLQGYQNFIRTWHVGIAPLLDTPFNRGRSDVKFLEYARAGVATIASRGPAYQSIEHGQTGLLVDSPEDFARGIEALINQPALRLRLKSRAARYVRGQRLCSATNVSLARFVAQLWGGRTKPEACHCWAWYQGITQGRSLHRCGRMSYLHHEKAEQGLVQGLELAQSGGLIGPLQEAQKAMPQWYLPHLYLGATGKNEPKEAIRHLLMAQKLCPKALHARYALAQHQLRNNRLREARESAAAALSDADIWANDASLWLLYSDALLTSNFQAACIEARVRAVQADGWHVPAATALSQLLLTLEPENLQQHPALPVALWALTNITQGHFNRCDGWYCLGRLSAVRQRWAEALEHFKRCDAALADADAVTVAPLTTRQECLAWLAKAALHTGDLLLAQRTLQRRTHHKALLTAVPAAHITH